MGFQSLVVGFFYCCFNSADGCFLPVDDGESLRQIMAIFHCDCSTKTKAKNESARSSYDYIAREGKHRKDKVDLRSIQSWNLPEFCAGDARVFWKAVDTHERDNARLCKTLEFSLPRELNHAQQAALTAEIVATLLAGHICPTSAAIHDGHPTPENPLGQPHCHIVWNERMDDKITRDAEQFFKRYNAKKPELGGAKKTRDYKPADWLAGMRKAVADITNTHLTAAGSDARISHLSLAEQGIDRLPSTHEGAGARAIFNKGGVSDRVNNNRNIQALNALNLTLKDEENGRFIGYTGADLSSGRSDLGLTAGDANGSGDTTGGSGSGGGSGTVGGDRDKQSAGTVGGALQPEATASTSGSGSRAVGGSRSGEKRAGDRSGVGAIAGGVAGSDAATSGAAGLDGRNAPTPRAIGIAGNGGCTADRDIGGVKHTDGEMHSIGGAVGGRYVRVAGAVSTDAGGVAQAQSAAGEQLELNRNTPAVIVQSGIKQGGTMPIAQAVTSTNGRFDDVLSDIEKARKIYRHKLRFDEGTGRYMYKNLKTGKESAQIQLNHEGGAETLHALGQNNAMAAANMLAIATERGWQSIHVWGAPDFQTAFYKAALDNLANGLTHDISFANKDLDAAYKAKLAEVQNWKNAVSGVSAAAPMASRLAAGKALQAKLDASAHTETPDFAPELHASNLM